MRETLHKTIQHIHSSGWCTGTSGNFSCVLEESPLKLLISPSGADKGRLKPEMLLEIDADGAVLKGEGKSSAETLLHLAVVKIRDAKCVLHTHSVANTTLSLHFQNLGYVPIKGLEMLKGLAGVATHEHEEKVPILANSQDMISLSGKVAQSLENHSGAHGFLLAGHGLYTWGRDVEEARRHVEVFEFLFEVLLQQLLLQKITL